jgi:hypothetical protein
MLNQLQGLQPVSRLGNYAQVWLNIEQRTQTLSNNMMIIGEHDCSHMAAPCA